MRATQIPRSVRDVKEVREFKRAAGAFLRKATASEKAANSTLMKLGVQDAKGNLTKQYR